MWAAVFDRAQVDGAAGGSLLAGSGGTDRPLCQTDTTSTSNALPQAVFTASSP
jgi:hypothetical protein